MDPLDHRFEYVLLRNISEELPKIVVTNQRFNIFKRIVEEFRGSCDLEEIVFYERVNCSDQVRAAVPLRQVPDLYDIFKVF